MRLAVRLPMLMVANVAGKNMEWFDDTAEVGCEISPEDDSLTATANGGVLMVEF